MAQLAQDARVVVAVDVFGRSGEGPDDDADTPAVMKRYWASAASRARATGTPIAFARSQSPGAVDPIVPMSAVDAMIAAFADRDDVVVVVHAGATHGFSHQTDAAFNAPAEAAAMNAVRELIALTSTAT